MLEIFLVGFVAFAMGAAVAWFIQSALEGIA